MQIAATVILYHPDENYIRNIKTYSDKIGKLYIIDNTEKHSQEFAGSLQQFKDSIYLHDGVNKGMSVRLNQACSLAWQQGFEWLLTMDQDSFFKNEEIERYLDCIQAFEAKETVSVFGVNFEKKIFENDFCKSKEVMHLITSGSLINLKVRESVGDFDEKLFIDEVDFEYCLRSVQKGFKIICFENIFLDHQLGTTSYYRSLRTSLKTARVLHSPTRMYYMTRNFLYIQCQYKNIFPGEVKQRKRILMNRIKNNIIYNRERFKVIKNILKGFRDVKKNKWGKLE